jgi:phosphopantetheinyl transferase (holo-ACP synthase)
MNSTGNDIVSLNAIDIARTQQPRFYSKILCAAEVTLYKARPATIPFEHYVWLLWSIKESAYKYLQRDNPHLVFSPTKFAVTQFEIPAINSPAQIEGIGFDEGRVIKSTVTVRSETLYSRSLVNDEFIFSVVNDEDNFENICWGIKSIDNSNPDLQSIEVRRFLMDKLESILPHDDLIITKSEHGCPILRNGNEAINIPVSLAHHNCWIAYSFKFQEIYLPTFNSIHSLSTVVN